MKRLLVLIVLGLAACGGGAKAAAPAITAPAISAECNGALKAVADAGSDLPDSQTVPLMDATLTACKSKAEWIAGAKYYQSNGLHAVIIGMTTNPETVWRSFCGSSTAPACVVTG